MGIRETMNKRPAIAAGLAVAIAIVAVGFVIYQIKHSGPDSSVTTYFTIDDGQSWFSDDAAKLTPFDKDGKQAVRVHLYKTPGGKIFVGYMDKYSDSVKKQIEGNRANHIPSMDLLDPENMLVKKPGAGSKWIGPRDPESEKVRQVTCPDGSAGAEPVVD